MAISMYLPSTKALQIFLATAQHLSFTRAARELHLTQGAVSRQIITLEEKLAVKLFYRHARGLSLTPNGQRFVPKAQALIEQLQQAVIEVARNHATLRINTPSCVTSWLLDKLMLFQQAHPEIEVELTSTISHHTESNYHAFDVVILYAEQPKLPGIDCVSLFEEKLTPLCSPELWHSRFDRDQCPPISALTQFAWLHANPMQSDWTLWLNALQHTKLASKTNQHFATLDQAMLAAQQGFGVAVGDVTLAEQDLKLKRLLQPFDTVVASGKHYYFSYPEQMDNPSLYLLRDWLLNACQSLHAKAQ